MDVDGSEGDAAFAIARKYPDVQLIDRAGGARGGRNLQGCALGVTGNLRIS